MNGVQLNLHQTEGLQRQSAQLQKSIPYQKKLYREIAEDKGITLERFNEIERTIIQLFNELY